MQREVLNRSVLCDGKHFPVGTPIELIPVENRESCRRSGWTHVVEVVEPGDQTDQTDPVADAASVGQQTLAASATENAEASATENADVNADSANAEDDAIPLADTNLELRVVELLASAGIETKGQAREYLNANKTFRIIEGVGKASDAAIRSVLGVE